MRIAVFGTGGVGGYFGALLARSGEDVTFIARGAHLAAIQAAGLQIQSVHGNFVVAPAQATDDPATIGPVDLILLTTKTYQLDEAAHQMAPLLGPHTAVLPLQNGVDAADRVLKILAETGGESAVLGGACWVVSAVAAPGIIAQQSQFRRIVIGELPAASRAGAADTNPRVPEIVAALARAGVQAAATEDIHTVLWTKFLFIASFSGLAAVARAPIGELLACPETRQLLQEAMAEVAAVAKAEGILLDPNVVTQTMAFCASMEPGATASMQRDILAGRPSELEAHNGYLTHRGAALGVSVPIHRYIYGVLLPQERRARGLA